MISNKEEMKEEKAKQRAYGLAEKGFVEEACDLLKSIRRQDLAAKIAEKASMLELAIDLYIESGFSDKSLDLALNYKDPVQIGKAYSAVLNFTKGAQVGSTSYRSIISAARKVGDKRRFREYGENELARIADRATNPQNYNGYCNLDDIFYALELAKDLGDNNSVTFFYKEAEKAALTGASCYAERAVKLGSVNQSFRSIAKGCSERADLPHLRDELSLLERSLKELRRW